MPRFLRRVFLETKGNAMVETAIAFAACFFSFIWLMEFCFSLYCGSVLSQAARVALQYATVHGTTSDGIAGMGSGPGSSGDPSGINIVSVAAAAMAQSALKQSLPGLRVCPAWWTSGSAQGGFSPSQCPAGGSGNLGNASYKGTGNANPGSIVTVQVVWTYNPYLPVPWSTTYTYTASGVITY
jgi:hypothetical protein